MDKKAYLDAHGRVLRIALTLAESYLHICLDSLLTDATWEDQEKADHPIGSLAYFANEGFASEILTHIPIDGQDMRDILNYIVVSNEEFEDGEDIDAFPNLVKTFLDTEFLQMLVSIIPAAWRITHGEEAERKIRKHIAETTAA